MLSWKGRHRFPSSPHELPAPLMHVSVMHTRPETELTNSLPHTTMTRVLHIPQRSHRRLSGVERGRRSKASHRKRMLTPGPCISSSAGIAPPVSLAPLVRAGRTARFAVSSAARGLSTTAPPNGPTVVREAGPIANGTSWKPPGATRARAVARFPGPTMAAVGPYRCCRARTARLRGLVRGSRLGRKAQPWSR